MSYTRHTRQLYIGKAAQLSGLIGNLADKANDPRYHSAWLRAYYLRDYYRARGLGKDGGTQWGVYLGLQESE